MNETPGGTKTPPHPLAAEARRLATALAAAPEGAALADHLAARADAFSPRQRQEFAAPPSPADAGRLREIVASDLEEPLERAFATFDVLPCAISRLSQLHRARLATGEPVLAQVRIAEIEPRSRRAARRLLPAELRAMVPAAALADALAGLPATLDPATDAAGIGRLAASPDAAPELCPASIRPRASRRRVMTFDDPGTRTAEEWLSDAAVESRRRIARRLCAAWLHQTFTGGLFPCRLDPTAVVWLDDERLIFLGGGLRSLPRKRAQEVRAYLVAIEDEEPDRAAAALARAAHAAGAERELRFRLRQSAPFRESGWDENEDWLAPRALLGWRALPAAGARVPAELADLFAGLTRLAALAARLEPRHDVLREALTDLRLRSAFVDLARLANARDATGAAATVLEAVTALPVALDRALGSPPESAPATRPEQTPDRDAWGAVGALLASAAGVALLAGRIAADSPWAPWADRLGFVALLALGALLLPSALRDR